MKQGKGIIEEILKDVSKFYNYIIIIEMEYSQVKTNDIESSTQERRIREEKSLKKNVIFVYAILYSVLHSLCLFNQLLLL